MAVMRLNSSAGSCNVALFFFVATLCASSSLSGARQNLSVAGSSLRARSTSHDLRILPVGDSITTGFRSSDGNGYRLDLLKLLEAAGGSPDAAIRALRLC